MIRKFEIIATVGSWKSEDGKTHKRTLAVGAIFESRHGNLVARIDAIPTAPDWSGWLQLKPVAADAFPPAALPPGRRVSPGMPAAPTEPDPRLDEPDDIPF